MQKLLSKEQTRAPTVKSAQDYSKQRQETNRMRLSKVLTKEEFEQVTNDAAFESPPCCGQCDVPYPLSCWRQKIHNSMAFNAIKEEDVSKPLHEFHQVDLWREDLSKFIRESSGSGLSDQSWQIKFFEFLKASDPKN